jgi:glycosyltransferase involved in cell wall biosynthesis
MLLSACMIVKDEEKQLPRCLDSIKDLCDEIIIVDTGSTDNTCGIALSYGAKIFYHPWQNDFSLHRNQAFGYASGEWLLVIDADEELNIPDVKEFRRRLRLIKDNVNSLHVTVTEIKEGEVSGSWLGPRFFRQSANPYYEGIVHNKIHIEGISAATDIVLKHYGYHLSKEKMEEKNIRTAKLLIKRIQKDPKDYWAMFYLAQMAAVKSDFKNVIHWSLKCLEHFLYDDPEELSCFGVIYYWLGIAYLCSKDGIRAYPCFMKGLEFFPDDIDLNFGMAYYGHMTMQSDLVEKHGNIYLKEMIKHKENVTSRLGKSDKFTSIIDGNSVINRTVYSLTDKHISMVKGWMNESSTGN